MKGPLTQYEVARELVLSLCRPMPAESVCLEHLLGRILAEPLISLVDMPRFDNSAVDGYGLRCSETSVASEKSPIQLKVVGEVRAGQAGDFEIHAGQAAYVLTGAPIPRGVEAVVMQEDVGLDGGFLQVKAPVTEGLNIRQRAEECGAGDELLPSGAVATPAVVSLMASAGHAAAKVFTIPRVALVSTGDELVDPGAELGPGQIYRSNSYGLESALKALGIRPVLSEHVPDDAELTHRTVERVLKSCDVLITSGGVSVGAHDHVKQALERCGVVTRFWGVAVKPGQPLFFGSLERKLVFGLPGNPVSVLVSFFVFVRPALLRMMGRTQVPHTLRATLESKIEAKGGKMEFVRGKLHSHKDEIAVEPIAARGSHMLGGLAIADCLIHVPPDVTKLEAGMIVDVTPLRWSEL